jgi:hypothetical protein
MYKMPIIHGLIIGDNTFGENSQNYLRATGAHRIATHLRSQGWNIEVVDFITRWSLLDFQLLCKKLVTIDTLMLGVSSNLMEDHAVLNSMLSWFKSQYPSVAIVLGGNHLLSRNLSPVDYLIEGNAEWALSDLMQYLCGNLSQDQLRFSNFRKDLKLVDATHDYSYNDTRDLAIHYQPSDFLLSHETLALETGRGCVFKCKFCTYPLIGKKRTDFLRDPDSIRQELLHNWQTHGTVNYILAEDTFNDSQDKLINLVQAISGLPFRPEFVGYIRFDLLLKRPDTLKLLRDIGMRAAFFGIETFDPADGRLVGKGMDPQRIKDGLLWWADEARDISTQVTMIAGLPNCNVDQLWQDKEWFEKSGLAWWSWSPLWFTDVTKTIHTSEFSYKYQEFGYEIMSDQEINDYIDRESKDNLIFQYNTKHNRQKMAFWKHQGNGLNFFTAGDLSNQLNSSSRTRRMGGFHIFSHASLGYSIDEVATWGYYDVKPHVPEQEMKERTQLLINQYIQNKILHDYHYETNNLLSKKVFRIVAD